MSESDGGQLRLQTFGTLRLESSQGPVAGPISQRHRLALLALLAAATGRQLSRDRLLGLLWPDSDEHSGRTLLNTTVHAVRKALGSEALRSVGDGLYLDPELLPSDLDWLEQHTRAGNAALAVEVYTGPFLDGFHLPESAAFEEWASATRAEYHRWVHDLLDQLATPVESPDPAARVAWTERLCRHEPHSALAAVRHLHTLAALGDRPAALEFAHEFQERLRLDLDVGPDAEVEAVRQALMREDVTVEPPAISRRRIAWTPKQTAAPSSPAPASARPRQARWLRGTMLGVAAIAAVVALKGPRPPAGPGVSESMVLVMPFVVRGNPELSYFGPGLMDLLAARINGMGALSTVDPAALVEFLTRDSAGSRGELSQARRASASFGADRLVLGTLIEVGTRLELQAGIYDGAGARLGEVHVSGTTATLPRMVNDLTRQLLAEHLRVSGLSLPSLAAQTTDSLAALRAYLQGENDMRVGDIPEAIRHFEEAVRVDPEFALGFYRLGLARNQQPGLPRPWWEREVDQTAARLAARLPVFERELVRTAAMPNGQALPIIRRLVAGRPSSAEAWYLLGMALDRESAARGTSNDEAIAAFEEALGLDPGHYQATRAKAYAVARAGNYERLTELAKQLAAISANDALLARTYLAFGREDQEAMEVVLRELTGAPEPLILEAAAAVTTLTRRPDLARPIYRLLLAPHHGPETRWQVHTRLADLAVAEGRWREARSEIEAADAVLGTRHLGKRARLAFLPFSPVGQVEAEAIRRELLAAFATGHSPEGPGRTIPILAYNAGMISAARADTAGIREAITALASLEGTAHAIRLPLLTRSLEAEIAWIAGEPQRVIALLANAVDPNSNQRFLMARALEAVGRTDEAMQWYRSYPDLSLNATNQLGWRAASLLQMAAIHDSRHDTTAAAAARSEFRRLWQNADPELQHLVGANE